MMNGPYIDGSTGPIPPQAVGCTFRIAGEAMDTKILSYDPDTQTGTLQDAITQFSTANGGGTLYFDSFPLDSDVMAVKGNVFLDGTWLELQALQYRQNQLYKEYPNRPIDGYGLQTAILDRIRVGRPVGYWIMPGLVQNQAWYVQNMQVWPMPREMHQIQYDVEVNAPNLLLNDFTGPNAATTYTPMPATMHETILLPMARIFLAIDPHFQESKRAVLEPIEAIKERLSKLNPQRQLGAVIRPPYWGPGMRGFHY